MLPAMTMFMVLAPIFIITGITIMSIGILYRIREQLIVSSGIILIGLGFALGVVALNAIDESLMIHFGWKYQYVKLLEGGIINPFKGPVGTSFVQMTAWASQLPTMIAASALIIIGIALLSYIGSLNLALEGWKALVAPVIVLILGFAGLYYMDVSGKLFLQGDIPDAIHAREVSAWLRTASILLGFIVVSIGAVGLYLETRGREYLLYSAAYVISAIGWAIVAVTFFTSFEGHVVFEYITVGASKTPLALFTLGGVLLVIGAIVLMVASIIEVVGSALAGAELGEELELPEELEEAPAEEEVPAEGEEAAKEGAEEAEG
ncbi:MAG: hypothetical protein F7C35_04140 [Desulfurococcales archaeon]|nr:hypothetical protein [Desulfurococcales archaeon]